MVRSLSGSSSPCLHLRHGRATHLEGSYVAGLAEALQTHVEVGGGIARLCPWGATALTTKLVGGSGAELRGSAGCRPELRLGSPEGPCCCLLQLLGGVADAVEGRLQGGVLLGAPLLADAVAEQRVRTRCVARLLQGRGR